MATKKQKGLGRGLDALLDGAGISLKRYQQWLVHQLVCRSHKCKPVNTSREPAWTRAP